MIKGKIKTQSSNTGPEKSLTFRSEVVNAVNVCVNLQQKYLFLCSDFKETVSF